MLDMHILLHVSLYLAFLFLIFTFATAGVYLVRIFNRRNRTTVAEADFEANMNNPQTKMSPMTIPPGFSLDPVVYPSAAKISTSSMRRLSINILRRSEDFAYNPQDAVPIRPPRPTRLDDLLAGFPYESHVSKDIWFPVANKGTESWELGVFRHDRPAAPNPCHRVMPNNMRKNVIISKRASYRPSPVPQ